MSSSASDTNAGLGVNVAPLHEAVVGNVRPVILLLQFAVGLDAPNACANVAHLLLGQAAERQAEIACASRWGRDAGASPAADRNADDRDSRRAARPRAGALMGVHALVAVAPASLPRLGEIGIDTTVLAFTIGVTLTSA